MFATDWVFSHCVLKEYENAIILKNKNVARLLIVLKDFIVIA